MGVDATVRKIRRARNALAGALGIGVLSSKGFLWVLVVGVLLGLAFVSGAVFAAKRIYPYERLVRFVKVMLPDAAPKHETIETAFHTLSAKTFEVAGRIGAESEAEGAGKLSWGGGIVVNGDAVIGVTGRGKFFLYTRKESEPTLTQLDILTDHNRGSFVSYAETQGVDSFDVERWFRHIDLMYVKDRKGVALILSHIYWHVEEKCFTLRLSKLPLGDVENLGQISKAADDWSVIYDTKPCLSLKSTGVAWAGLQAGGRMAVTGNGEILLTVGDFQFDGYNSQEVHPQDRASDYGKIIRVNPRSGTSEIVSIGHRNAQGLALAPDGKIWSTEHGPDGGDELNLIDEGRNYGWPYVVYGTWYGQKVWPLSISQGRHPNFQRPVFAWLPSIAVSNLLIIERFSPEWDGDILVSSFDRYLYRMRYEEDRIIFVESIFVGERVRDIALLQDGTIALWNDGGTLTELSVAEAGGIEVGDWMPMDFDAAQRRKVGNTILNCLGCHSARPSGPASTAPNLWRVYDRPIGDSAEYVGYSEALKRHPGAWTDDALNEFLRNPESFAPGNAMEYPPIADEDVRRAVIAYLRSLR